VAATLAKQDFKTLYRAQGAAMIKWIARSISAATVAAVLAGISIYAYYYVTTPSEVFIIVANELPPNFSPGFTAEALSNDLLAAMTEIRAGAAQQSVQVRASEPQLGFQVAPVTEPPTYRPPADSFPLFDVKLGKTGIRAIVESAVYKKANHIVAIDTFAVGTANFRLRARLLDKPGYERNSAHAPVDGGTCSDSEKCTHELAEEILSRQDPGGLLSYYVNQGGRDASLKIVRLYESGRVPRNGKSGMRHDDFLNWAGALRSIGEYNQAIHKYQEALTAGGGKSCSDHDEIGYAYRLKYDADGWPQDLEQGANAFKEGIKCNSNDAIAYCDLGNVLIRQWTRGKKLDSRLADTALLDLQHSLAINPQLAAAAINIGYLQYQRGDHDQSLVYFQDIDQKFPNNAALLLNYGYLLYLEYLSGKSDLLDDALDKTQRAWDVDRSSYAAANNLGFLYLEAGSAQKAVDHWSDAYKLQPSDADVVAGLAVGLFDIHETQKAIQHFREAKLIEADIGDPVALRDRHHWSPKAVEHVMPLIELANKAN
jgi:tetratricopeptide (TPR) repeat protein